jgi:hypothetical protein
MNTQYQLVREWENDTITKELYPVYLFYKNGDCSSAIVKVTEEQARAAFEIFKKEFVDTQRRIVSSETVSDLSGVAHKIEFEICLSKFFNYTLLAKDIYRMDDYYTLYIWDGTKIIKSESAYGNPSDDLLSEFNIQYNKRIEFVKSYKPQTTKEILITENVESYA